MSPSRFQEIAQRYSQLRIAVIGDFCLDRYLEIDGTQQETSIETGLPVHNIINVRAQPGGAGTILSNLVALGIGIIYPAGFCGKDAEGFELKNALFRDARVRPDYFLETDQRRTFTYCKPLVLKPGQPPIELNRFDFKNWTPTPEVVEDQMIEAVTDLADKVDALILLDQVGIANTGVITTKLLAAIEALSKAQPNLLILADSRQRLKDFPACSFKINRQEFCAMTGLANDSTVDIIKEKVRTMAQKKSRPVFVTLSENGILGASADGDVMHVPALPLRGPIDIVGAGDAVTANITAALAAGSALGESLEIANAAASIVIHKIGTTGTATPSEIKSLLAK